MLKTFLNATIQKKKKVPCLPREFSTYLCKGCKDLREYTELVKRKNLGFTWIEKG